MSLFLKCNWYMFYSIIFYFQFHCVETKWMAKPMKRVLENRYSESCSLNCCKVADWEPATLLKMNFVIVTFQGFWQGISSGNSTLRTPIFKNTFFPEHCCGCLWNEKNLLKDFCYKFFFSPKYLFANFSMSLNIKL